MTREEVTIQALRNHIEVLKERLTALEQEQKYCDRNICTSNEYNGIRCEECEVAKSQEHLVNESGNLVKDLVKDAISRQAVLSKIKEVCFSEEWLQFRVDNGSNGQRDFLINYIENLLPVTPIHRDRTVQDFVDKCRECGREKVIDKIRAEINDVAFDWQEIDGEHESFKVVDLNGVFNIIDKYKAEMESEK